MTQEQTITVWKSDFKDFPGLYEATMWCIGRATQKAENFVVIKGYNPYELRNEERFQSGISYIRCYQLAQEYNWLANVTPLLNSMKYNAIEVFRLICSKLDYPEGHINRLW